MAATEYYQRRPSVSAQASYLSPPPPPQSYSQPNSAPNTSPHLPPQMPSSSSYPQPLDPGKPGVHFVSRPPLPPPSTQHRNSYSHAQRPSPQAWNQPHSIPPPPSNQQPIYPSQQYLAPPPHTRFYGSDNPSQTSMDSGYSSDPEPHRRRRRYHHGRQRAHSTTSRSVNADGLIGAAGGGLLGDLIMPGLGTVGGALAGWFGGKDYGHHRKWREEKRHREQEQWERKWRHRSRSRSRERHERKASHG